VALDDVGAFYVDPALGGVDAQHTTGAALVLAGDHADHVVAADLHRAHG
jgi:hypothetical protein